MWVPILVIGSVNLPRIVYLQYLVKIVAVSNVQMRDAFRLATCVMETMTVPQAKMNKTVLVSAFKI